MRTVRYEWTKVRDAEAAAEVEDILRVGWKLNSTAMAFVERTGFNNITCMVVEGRPQSFVSFDVAAQDGFGSGAMTEHMNHSRPSFRSGL